jgi:hypothetical protein
MDPTPASAATEIMPGLYHYTQVHPNIGIDVDSYYLYDERVLIDPMVPAEGLDWFVEQEKGPPTDILLSCRHHYRHSGEFVQRFGCTVWCVEQGMHEFGDRKVSSFEFGDVLPGGAESIEIDAISPDEGSFMLSQWKALLCSDGVVRFDPKGGLGFVPDQYMDEPEKTKAGLVEAYRGLLERDFEHLLLTHGGFILGDGKQALERFVESNS